MSPRTVQIWFQNKRQSWRAQKQKMDGSTTQSQHQAGLAAAQSSGFTDPSGSYSPHHPLRTESFGSGSSHGRMPSSAEESAREEGGAGDEVGAWEVLKRAQESRRDYRMGGGPDPDDDGGFEDETGRPDSPHHHRMKYEGQ